MNHSNALGGVRVSIGFCRRAMCRPARVANADSTRQRLHAELGRQISQLPFRATTSDLARFESGYPCAVISAVFQALERINQSTGDWRITNNAYNTAHAYFPFAAFFARARSRS